MSIRALVPTDHEAYAEFRRELWPSHPGGGHWEALVSKYFLNPHQALCPESGLYGYFQGDRLSGIMGAFPLPVTLKGAVYPGHMLVDWAVLPNFRFGPVAGELWNALIRLPGRKYASNGSRFSQGPLQKRGDRIPTTQATALLMPLHGIATKILRLSSYSYPSPLHLDRLDAPPGVSFLDNGQVRAAVPFQESDRARVHRDGSFWQFYCRARVYNGAFPLRLACGAAEADLVVSIVEVGRFRLGTLLSAYLSPYTVVCAHAVGKLLGAFLRRNGVCVLSTTEADAELQALISATAIYVRRSPCHWWSIPRPTDSFRHDQVSWWLTSADRDSHFGGLQPFKEP